jgi:hypothetical protein
LEQGKAFLSSSLHRLTKYMAQEFPNIPLKKFDWLLVKSFIGPFILTFFIALFVLVMQFLWKYIDDLVGKGLNGCFTFLDYDFWFFRRAFRTYSYQISWHIIT